MVTTYSSEAATAKAIRLAGGPQVVAKAMQIRSLESVYKWLRLNRVPAERVLLLVRLTQDQVTPHDLRPDIYPEDGEAA